MMILTMATKMVLMMMMIIIMITFTRSYEYMYTNISVKSMYLTRERDFGT